MSKTQTRTRTVIRTRSAFDEALRHANLTAQEEQVLRMRYGISADLHAPLAYADADDAALHAQLSAIEQKVLAHLRGSVDAGRREAIIDRLKGM